MFPKQKQNSCWAVPLAMKVVNMTVLLILGLVQRPLNKLSVEQHVTLPDAFLIDLI
jgi:hypothetical protein